MKASSSARASSVSALRCEEPLVHLLQLDVAHLQLRLHLLQLRGLQLQLLRLRLQLGGRLLRLPAGRLRLAEEPGVVDGDRRPPRQLLRQPEVRLAVAPGVAPLHEAERRQRAPARDQRDADVRAQSQRAGDPQVLLVHRRPGQHLVRDLRHQLRLAGAEHVRHPEGRVGVGRIALVQRVRQLHLLRVRVRDGDPADRAVGRELVHGAPLGEVAHGEARHRGQRGVVVEGGGEEIARRGQQLALLLVAVPLGDVGDLRDDPPHRPVLVAERRVGEVHEVRLGDSVAVGVPCRRHADGLVRDPGRPDPVEDLEESLGPELREEAGQRAADRVAPADDAPVGRAHGREHVLRPTQHGGGGGKLLDQADEFGGIHGSTGLVPLRRRRACASLGSNLRRHPLHGPAPGRALVLRDPGDAPDRPSRDSAAPAGAEGVSSRRAGAKRSRFAGWRGLRHPADPRADPRNAHEGSPHGDSLRPQARAPRPPRAPHRGGRGGLRPPEPGPRRRPRAPPRDHPTALPQLAGRVLSRRAVRGRRRGVGAGAQGSLQRAPLARRSSSASGARRSGTMPGWGCSSSRWRARRW